MALIDDVKAICIRHGFQKSAGPQIMRFRALRRLLGMVRAPSFSVRLTRERGDATDGMRPCGQPDRLD
jgi:hypothetical protein